MKFFIIRFAAVTGLNCPDNKIGAFSFRLPQLLSQFLTKNLAKITNNLTKDKVSLLYLCTSSKNSMKHLLIVEVTLSHPRSMK